MSSFNIQLFHPRQWFNGKLARIYPTKYKLYRKLKLSRTTEKYVTGQTKHSTIGLLWKLLDIT